MVIGMLLLVLAMFVLRAVFPRQVGRTSLGFAFAVIFLAAGANLWLRADYTSKESEREGYASVGIALSLFGVALSAGQFRFDSHTASAKEEGSADKDKTGK